MSSYFTNLFGQAAPAGQKKRVNPGGLDDAFDLNALVGGMYVFGFGAITGGLPLAEKMENAHIGSAGRILRFGILPVKNLVTITQHIERWLISFNYVTFGLKSVEFKLRGVFLQPGIRLNSFCNRVCNTPLRLLVGLARKK